MKKIKIAVLVGIFGATLSILYTNCSDSYTAVSGSYGSGGGAAPLNVNLTQPNVMALTTGCGYVNEPCVTVTVCIPGTTTCQSIPNVLLDTGSYGLRLFKQVTFDNFQSVTNLVNLPLSTDPGNSSNAVSECVSYADGSSDWGPVALADVTMGGENAFSVPVQVINSNFSNPSDPSVNCTNLDQTPLATGFNGILGVGLFKQDCGVGCVGDPSNGIYFSCPANGGGTCSGMSVQLNQQVANPVSFLPVDNNGVILSLPSLTDAGTTVSNGFVVFGIGTQTNNIPVGATTFYADNNANFATVYNGVTMDAFIDSGSNALYFPDSSITQCTANSGFYCPTSQLALSAVQQGVDGSAAQLVSFNVANADAELDQNNPNLTFNNLAGTMSGGSFFDWGLPFFFGRTVFVGIESGSSSLGTGPLWAY